MMAQLVIFCRKRRGQFLPSGVCGEPAWEVLLALYTRQKSERQLASRELAAWAAVPLSTALRWIDYLVSEGLAQREGGGDDAPVELSALGRAQLDNYFSCIWEGLAGPATHADPTLDDVPSAEI